MAVVSGNALKNKALSLFRRKHSSKLDNGDAVRFERRLFFHLHVELKRKHDFAFFLDALDIHSTAYAVIYHCQASFERPESGVAIGY